MPAAGFDLADEGGNLNFNILACGIKIAYLSCQMLYEDLITLLSSFDCLNLTTLGFKTIQHCSIIRIQDFLEDIKNGQL